MAVILLFGNHGNSIQDIERNDYISLLRNKLLAKAFYLTGDIEKYGTGFIRIRESLEGYPDIKFSFSEQGDFFKAELRYTPKKAPKKVSPVFLTELEQLILSAIKKDNTITLNRLAGKLNLSKYTVAEYTDKLKAMFILEKTGVASVHGEAFFHKPGSYQFVRFCFAKKDGELDEACSRLGMLSIR